MIVIFKGPVCNLTGRNWDGVPHIIIPQVTKNPKNQRLTMHTCILGISDKERRDLPRLIWL